MKTIYFFLAFLFFTCSMSAQQPIQLGNINMPVGGDTLRYSNTSIQSIGNYTQTGANFHWDFSHLQFTSQSVRQYKNANQTPYAFYFLSSGAYGEKIADTIDLLIMQLTNYYNFYRKQTAPAAYVVEGVGITFTGVAVPSYYSDRDELYKFPMTYPQHDSSTFQFSTISNSMIPISYSKKGYRITDVDGWGTITTPFGTQECLRLITTQYSRDTVIINISGLPFQLPPIGIPNYQRSYQWLTKTSKIPFLEVTGNVIGNNFLPTTVRYRDSVRSFTPVEPPIGTGIEKHKDISGLELYPNPVSDKLFLLFQKPDTYNIEIYTTDGKLLKTLQTEALNSTHGVDVENLPVGLYVIKVATDKKQQCFKFIKQ
ncbi:MAG: T9SS type A sorting domain-containing protein [Bacteroidetes bacterium]|nr:T9SS type A sorting domain-containing protein [Bacteroidota bacterium]